MSKINSILEKMEALKIEMEALKAEELNQVEEVSTEEQFIEARKVSSIEDAIFCIDGAISEFQNL